MDSILSSIKKLITISEDDHSFDDDIIMHINTNLSILTQLGVTTSGVFFIQSSNEKWSDYILDNQLLALIIQFVYLKVKLVFDPPSSASVIEAINRAISELEWRIQDYVDK